MAFNKRNKLFQAFNKRNSASSSSSTSDQFVPETELLTNVVIKIGQHTEEQPGTEEDPPASIEISPEAAAEVAIKLEEVFNLPDKEIGDDENSY